MSSELDEIVAPQTLDISTKEKLKLYITKIENLETEKDEVTGQIAEVYADAKALGFDTKALRKVVARRKKDAKVVAEEEMMLDLYLHALGEI